MEAPDRSELRVLVLAPLGRDATLVADTLREAGVPCDVCRDLEGLRLEAAEGAGAILVTEDVLRPRAVNDLADMFARQLPWSDLPLLIFSAGRDDASPSLLDELKRLAFYTLIDRPTRKKTLISAVQTALRARRRQYQVRDLLGELEKSVRSRDQFLAMLSHELRNPLAAILTAVLLMERRNPSMFVAERGMVQRQARLLARLVDDLLDVSRVTLGKVVLSPGLVDMGALVERCVKAQLSTAAEQGVALTLTQPADASVVEGDPVRLEQVVTNLLTNALKYTPRGGHVGVSAAADGRTVTVRVTDDGVGIDPDVLPRIFDLFAQDDQTLDRSRGGLGVGLTLVRSLVALHGGTVAAESPGRGKGSAFTVRLPLAAGKPASPASSHDQTVRPLASEPSTVLIIDDNSDVRVGLRDLLRTEGHDVLVSAGGEEGIAIALARHPQTVLIDIGLPGLDGYAVVRRLRDALGSSVKLVALTGYGTTQDRERALGAGFDEHITKPASLVALNRALARSDLVARSPIPAKS